MGNSQFQIPNGGSQINTNIMNLKTCLDATTDFAAMNTCFSQNVTDTNNSPLTLMQKQGFDNTNKEQVDQAQMLASGHNFLYEHNRLLVLIAIMIALFLIFRKN